MMNFEVGAKVLGHNKKGQNQIWTKASGKSRRANAIIELLHHFDWNYVSIVYSDSEYGETGFESIKKIIEKEQNICLGEAITIYNYHFRGNGFNIYE